VSWQTRRIDGCDSLLGEESYDDEWRQDALADEEDDCRNQVRVPAKKTSRLDCPDDTELGWQAGLLTIRPRGSGWQAKNTRRWYRQRGRS
jgi:hypothetical protein